MDKIEKTDIKSLSLQELTDLLVQMGEKAFRAKQLYAWMHVKLAEDFSEMTDLSVSLRDKCKACFAYTCLEAVRVQESALDGTKKFLFRLSDGNLIESVWMRYKHGNSVCVSSQAGCRMGCRFCASAIGGLERSLTASEMLDQIYAITRITGERVSNVVIMGTGEPLDNYENVMRFIRLLTDENGLHISQRNVTLSTCGIVPRIRELAREDLQITLAISLHASNNETRKELMPVANQYPLDELLAACREYFEKTGRRLTFEYSLVRGVNDTKEDAEELAALLKSMNRGGKCGDVKCHVNLIPVNPVKERDFEESAAADVQQFKNHLERKQINVTVRREMGRDIDGACGQLRRSYGNTSKAL